jgi:hypothetical protein
MKKSMMKAAVVAVGLLGAMQAQAFEAKWDLGFGYDVGGDRLGTVSVNGSDTNVNTNKGAAFTLGAAFANDDAKQFETAASIGFKTGGPRAKNGTVTFTSLPLSLMEFYRPNDVRLGLGLSYNMSPEYTQSIDGASDNGSLTFKDAMGLVAQVGWAPINQRYSVDLRYTSIKYQPNVLKVGGASYDASRLSKLDGSSLGFYTSIRF